jgi:hypothetical protein
MLGHASISLTFTAIPVIYVSKEVHDPPVAVPDVLGERVPGASTAGVG